MKNFITRLVVVRSYLLARKYGASPTESWTIVLRSFWNVIWRQSWLVIGLLWLACLLILASIVILVRW